MPSLDHEALALLFRVRPTLAAELVRDVLGVSLPAHSAARLDHADFTQITPTEYRADVAVLFFDEEPVLGIVVEIQLARDNDKQWVWPLYAVALRARRHCDACVLVIAPDEQVASWARQCVCKGLVWQFTPLVLGPRAVPVVTDHEHARAAPELAVLSAIAHGNGEQGLAVAKAAFAAIACLDGERAALYTDLVYETLGRAARRAMEDEMVMNTNQHPKYEFTRKFLECVQRAKEELRAEERAAGLAEGLAEGRTAGQAEGRIAGLAEGRAWALLSVLSARELPVSEEQRAHILACRDLDRLDRWIRGATSADSVGELLAGV
ncbi:MAG: hypothetical protein V2A73_07310 [Pseudomonadota bacterium]